MARADQERDPEHATRAVAPGALSALLEELAYAPAPEGKEKEALLLGPRPGTVIGRFELQGEIGRGGFGVVYVARDRELRRLVAFKLVRPGRLERGEDQLRREAEVIAQLQHPNLVTLFDVGRSEHGPYLVLELLRGETLEERIQRTPFPVADAVRIGCEVAKGLAYAHAQGVVHRDLKPSNVFLCQGGAVKLLDFGMSHAFGWRRVEGGTPAYMAPEQLEGAPEDERTDVYALGVMLYRMLAGEFPFARDTSGKPVRTDRPLPVLEVPGEPALGELVGRMLAPVPTGRPRDAEEVGASLAALQDSMARSGHPPAGPVRARRAARRWPIVAALLASLVGAGLAVYLMRPPRQVPAARMRAIAVLPFVNRSDSAEAEYFSDGLTDEIRNLLTRLRELKVAASTSSFHFKNRTGDIADVAQKLRVDVVLEGTVRRDKDRLRISAELVDARSGFRVWSQIYDRRLEDVFAIQDDIARQVAGALEVVLSGDSEGRLRKPHQADLAAYDLYLRARALLRKPSSQETLDEATALLEKAVATDSRFAAAYAGLCDTWLARYKLARASASFDNAERACGEALARDSEAAEVYEALGSLHLASGRYPDAEREFTKARALAPNSVDAILGLADTQAAQRNLVAAEKTLEQARTLDPGYWRVYQRHGRFLMRSARYEEAARAYAEVAARIPGDESAMNDQGGAYFLAGEFEKAARAWHGSLEVAPSTEAYSNTGTSYFFLGRFEEAAAMYRKALDLAPEDYRVWGNLGDAYSHASGREADAVAAYRKAAILAEARLRINGADAYAMSLLAHYQESLGQTEEARATIAEALKRDPADMYVQYHAALVALRLGDQATALERLERAAELGYQRQILDPDAALAPLRQHKRFRALVAPGPK